jgi:hypothetical protein
VSTCFHGMCDGRGLAVERGPGWIETSPCPCLGQGPVKSDANVVRLLVCGSREWPGSWEDIAEHLPEGGDVTVIHGACSRKVTKVSRGSIFHDVEVSVDMLADFAARGLGHHVVPFPADWSIGRKAGPIRNSRMLTEGKPDRALAFGALFVAPFNDRGKRTGTGDMVAKLLAAGIPVRWVEAPGQPARDLTALPTS